MKKLPKIFLIFFLSIFILQLACLIFLLVIPEPSEAAEVKFTPQVSIGESGFQKGVGTTPSIAKYIQAIYNYAIGIVGILAAVVLMFGGVIWLTAGGSQEKVKEAKAWISASLSGLVLVLCSYMILNTINPDLVSFKEIAPKMVPKIVPKKDISELKDITCEDYLDEQICGYSVGCKWENGKCILDTGYAKCGLTKEEKTGIARCCEQRPELIYKYALVPLNQSCLDVCGSGWVLVDPSKCENNLRY